MTTLICGGCRRPERLHCPGCGTCWPDHMCALGCDATENEIEAVLDASDEWELEHRTYS